MININIKKHIFFLIIGYLLLTISCDLDSANERPKEYISVYLINCTEETIAVYAEAVLFIFALPLTHIPPGGQQNVSVEKGKTVSFYGQTTNKQYGSRSFYFETQWEIH